MGDCWDSYVCIVGFQSTVKQDYCRVTIGFQCGFYGICVGAFRILFVIPTGRLFESLVGSCWTPMGVHLDSDWSPLRPHLGPIGLIVGLL